MSNYSNHIFDQKKQLMIAFFRSLGIHLLLLLFMLWTFSTDITLENSKKRDIHGPSTEAIIVNTEQFVATQEEIRQRQLDQLISNLDEDAQHVDTIQSDTNNVVIKHESFESSTTDPNAIYVPDLKAIQLQDAKVKEEAEKARKEAEAKAKAEAEIAKKNKPQVKSELAAVNKSTTPKKNSSALSPKEQAQQNELSKFLDGFGDKSTKSSTSSKVSKTNNEMGKVAGNSKSSGKGGSGNQQVREMCSKLNGYLQDICQPLMENFPSNNYFKGQSCEIIIKIAPNGKIIDRRVVKGSSNFICGAALEAIGKTTRLPNPPDNKIREQSFTFSW